ncbi:MAG: hydantoinase/oxoprolinase family protein [Promethearchaeota archaeon]
MKTILGLDIGGANTKAALITFKNNLIEKSLSHIEYFPFWEKTIEQIPEMFKRIISRLLRGTLENLKNIDQISITITAEISDAFQTKREGILTILAALQEVFEQDKMKFISNIAKFLTFKEAKSNPLSIAAANWVSTALFLGMYVPQCILIDSGSTTIDLIPIKDSIPVAKGKNDISRLINHELIYMGGLRATIPSITHHVPYKKTMVRISFEKFALISDVHRILNNISEQEYINDTADHRSKTLEHCYARMARIICMDEETIERKDLDKIARYIHEKQLTIISKELQLFLKDLMKRFPSFKDKPLFVLTGLSANFLIKPVLERLGYNNIVSYESVTNIPDNVSSSAFAVAGALYYTSL